MTLKNFNKCFMCLHEYLRISSGAEPKDLYNEF